MKWKVLVTAPYMQPVVNRFTQVFAENDIELVLPKVNERLDEEELLAWVNDIDGAICGDDRWTTRVLESAPRLKVLSKWGTGIDSIDQAACARLSIAVRNTPNAFSEPVADSVLGYIICFARRLLDMNRAMRTGLWKKIQGYALHECTLGVIGVGNVGKTVARRAVACGMTVYGNDLLEMPADFVNQTGITMVPKEELLQRADFISINCDLNPTSYHLITDQEFSLMKKTAVFINTARGPIVDEPALIRALLDKRISGAALDVFESEPLSGKSQLLSMDNVLLAPHNANSSPETYERIHQNTIANLLEELKKAK
jgi:D-3-phosphoglycerate dehydrogenase